MRQVIALDEPDAMLAGHRSFHLDGTLDHAVDDGLGGGAFRVIEEEDGFWGRGVVSDWGKMRGRDRGKKWEGSYRGNSHRRRDRLWWLEARCSTCLLSFAR